MRSSFAWVVCIINNEEFSEHVIETIKDTNINYKGIITYLLIYIVEHYTYFQNELRSTNVKRTIAETPFDATNIEDK